GPWDQLIIRGVTLVNSTGAPPLGPVDIVVKDNKIADVVVVGAPGQPIDENRRPALAAGGRELDATGMYIMPGFIDMHAHIKSWVADKTDFEYVFKLWMAHGVTTVVDPGCFNGIDPILDVK